VAFVFKDKYRDSEQHLFVWRESIWLNYQMKQSQSFLELQWRKHQLVHQAAATGCIFFERFGGNRASAASVLEQLPNIKRTAISSLLSSPNLPCNFTDFQPTSSSHCAGIIGSSAGRLGLPYGAAGETAVRESKEQWNVPWLRTTASRSRKVKQTVANMRRIYFSLMLSILAVELMAGSWYSAAALLRLTRPKNRCFS